MHCSNCADEAMYIYDPRGAVATYFCGSHLPSFLQKSAKSGALKTTDHFSDVRASALAELRAMPPIQEATEEEPAPVEEAPTPTPRRRRPRKKAEVEVPAEVAAEAVVEDVTDEADSES